MQRATETIFAVPITKKLSVLIKNGIIALLRDFIFATCYLSTFIPAFISILFSIPLFLGIVSDTLIVSLIGQPLQVAGAFVSIFAWSIAAHFWLNAYYHLTPSPFCQGIPLKSLQRYCKFASGLPILICAFACLVAAIRSFRAEEAIDASLSVLAVSIILFALYRGYLFVIEKLPRNVRNITKDSSALNDKLINKAKIGRYRRNIQPYRNLKNCTFRGEKMRVNFLLTLTLFILAFVTVLYLSNSEDLHFTSAYSPFAVYVISIVIWLCFICGGSILASHLCFFLYRTKFEKADPHSLWKLLITPQVYSLFALVYFLIVFSAKAIPENTAQNAPIGPYVSFHEYVLNWSNGRVMENDEFPIVFIATAGGGLRAAVWTTSVLEKLAEGSDLFLDRTFSVSAVSGGSLGAVSFYASLKRSPNGLLLERECLQPTLNKEEFVSETTFAGNCLREFFKRNSLSPVIAATFFYHPMQWVRDRGRTQQLFASWKQNWMAVMQDQSIEEPLIGFGDAIYPLFALNATVAESGQRFVFSNVRIPNSIVNGHFLSWEMEAEGMSMIEAAGYSATFPIISRPQPIHVACNSAAHQYLLGENHKKSCEENPEYSSTRWGHITDGGYFENFGARTVIDIARHTLDMWEALSLPGKPVPIIIQISSDPSLDALIYQDDRRLTQEMSPSETQKKTFGTPPRTLMRTRSSSSLLHLRDAEKFAKNNGGDFFHVGMCDVLGQAEPPLTWYLSVDFVDQLYDDILTSCLSEEGAISDVDTISDIVLKLSEYD